jgi:Txe/YoeB family toxin of Txe-Axe toxin-antitoxin module
MVDLIYANERIKKDLSKLKNKDPEFFRHIENALRNIQEDPVCGIKIPIKLIPKKWTKEFQINNLYKYNLPNAWRLLYSLTGSKVEIIAIILGCFNHKEYERKFKY